MRLPAVGGRRVERPLSELERGALILLAEEQNKHNPNNALVAVLCDTVRLIREHSDSVTANLTALSDSLQPPPRAKGDDHE